MKRLLAERRTRAAAEQKGALTYHDPIEDDPAFQDAIEAARHSAGENYAEQRRGTCHLVWREQRRILADRHGITWFSPQDMNPGTRFD